MDKIMHTDIDRKTKIYKLLGFTSAFILLLIIAFVTPKLAKAADTGISIKEINYYNSTITLQVNGSDTEIYFSDSKKKTWETVPGEISSSNTITMDISWISLSKNYVMTFKGNKSTAVTTITLPKQVTNFKASFNRVKSTVTFGNAGTRKIEWRKKGSSTWHIVDTTTLGSEISYLYTNGATLYFRLAPVNGTSSYNVGYRASQEITVSIPKKTAAPAITVDGSKFTIAVKKGMAYRYVNSDGSTTDWMIISSSADLQLKSIASASMYQSASTAQKETTLQFRTNATSGTQVSQISTVTIPLQEASPNVDTYGISFTYTSSSTLSLQVKAASSAIPFEYAIIEEDEELNYQTVAWKAISSSAAVNIDSEDAPIGCHIYIRKKSIKETSTLDFALASVEADITGIEGVAYPNAPKATTLATLITTAGVCQVTKSSSYLTFSLYSATSTTVSALSFYDAYGINKGAVTCKSTVAKNTNSTGTSDKYIITTKITSTSSIDSITEELLYAEITLANSDVITSTSTAGILLYLYPNTTVNNPEGEDDYTDSFKRVYLSNEAEDDRYFKFQLDFGTAKVIDTTAVNSYTTEATAINSIEYDEYTLTNGTDYTVEYGTYIDDDDKTIATATVTVNVSSFESSSLIDNTDKALPLEIQLNNGEILDDKVSVTLINTATVSDTPIAWSITEGSLKETKTSIITNTDETTSTVTEEVITYTLTLSIFDKNYGVGVSDVTWGDTSIFGSAKISNGKATIYLSNAKINKLVTNSTDTRNIVITLSNGFVIKTGCKLTILNAS